MTERRRAGPETAVGERQVIGLAEAGRECVHRVQDERVVAQRPRVCETIQVLGDERLGNPVTYRQDGCHPGTPVAAAEARRVPPVQPGGAYVDESVMTAPVVRFGSDARDAGGLLGGHLLAGGTLQSLPCTGDRLERRHQHTVLDGVEAA